MPVVLIVSQSTLLPHAQADGLAAEPSVVAHSGGREQVLDTAAAGPGPAAAAAAAAAVQTMPVPCPSPLLVHGLFPQMQRAALLGADPPVFVQAGAVRVHMHVVE